MSVPYHAWTHSTGGTDPIEFPASSDLLWAMGSRSQSNVFPSSGDYRVLFDSLYSNSTSAFELTGVSGSVADWIQINEPGYYLLKQVVIKSSVFDNTDLNTFVQPLFESSGTPAGLQANLGVADYMGVFYNPLNELLAGGKAYNSLAVDFTFNWDPDNPASDIDFENPLKIGCQLATQDRSLTISLGMYTFLLRLAGAGYHDLSPS